MSENNQNRDPNQGSPQNPQQTDPYQPPYGGPNQPPHTPPPYGANYQGGQNPQGYQNSQWYNNQPNHSDWNQQNYYGGYNPQGNPQGYNNQRPPVPPPYYTGYSVDNTKVFSILSYIWLLWLVGLLADRDNPKVRFHVNQGIILTIFTIILDVAVAILKGIVKLIFTDLFSGVFLIPAFGSGINAVLGLIAWGVPLALMIIGIVHAAQDREEPLPFIGTMFKIL
ncbi:MAG TPA: hypothetical protein GXX74_06165 [Clostridiales bacterium]|nr:hypothetical protein [Clostridiales bacterium]